MNPTGLPYPIGTALRRDRNPVPLLLYCPDEDSWLLGLWSEGANRAGVQEGSCQAAVPGAGRRLSRCGRC